MFRVTAASPTYACGTSSQNVGQPTTPPYENLPGDRSRAASNPRYFIRDTSGDGLDDTFGKIY